MGGKKDLQFEQMFELLPDGVLLIDTATGLPLRFNEKAHTHLGYSQEEFAKLSIADYEAKETPQQTQAHIQKILANKRDDFETQHRSKNGDILDMRVTVILLQTDSAPHLLCVFRDITPQKQLERQVQKEKEAVNFILEETVGGYWDWDLKNNTEYLSPGLKKMLGYEDHELPNAPESWMKLIFKTDLDTTMQNYDAHIQSKGRIPFSQEVRYRHKDGSIVWVVCSGKVIEWDSKGNPLRMVGSHIDITRQKQLQQQLQESQQRFSDVAKASGEYIWELDAKGEYTFLTKPFEDMLGYTIPESLGQTPFSFMPHDEAKHVEEYFAKEVAAKESAFTNLIHKSVSKEGHTVWQKVNGLPMYDREGNLTGYRGAALDITKEKTAQDELESAKKRLEVTIKAAKIGLWEFNLQTGEVYWDRYAYEMLGYSDQEFAMSYEKWKELIHPHDLQEAQQKLQTQIEQKNAFILEFRFKRKDGSWSWIEGRGEVTQYDQDNKPLKMAGIHIDKNSQKQIEHSLDEAKQKAEAASEAKTQFLANMSHEIRTPMNAIIGLGDVLYDQMSDEKQKDILNKINNSSKMLLGIINDILDYSKIEAGKLELEDTEFALESVLSQLKVMFEHKASQKGIELYFHLKGRLPALVRGDQLRLTQVLTNLLSNSIKFTEKGSVTLSIAPDSFEDDGTALVKFCVTDTGIGMSQSQLDKLFVPFTQADTSTTRKYGGTGLGLVIAQNIVKAFGSSIHVTSTPEKGTAFSFSLRLGATACKVGQKSSERLQRVLIVDDQPISRTILKDMMEEFECEFDEAGDGLEALEAIQKADRQNNPYDLVLLDWKMPKLDGAKTIEKLRAMESKGEIRTKIPTLFMISAYTKDEFDMQEASVDHFISKPVTPSLLFDAIAQAKGAKTKKSTPGQKRLPDLGSLHLLVAEDNELNQEVITMILNKVNAGYEIAENGQKALELLEHDPGRFDAVLMDLHMPVMNGYEAAKRIRKSGSQVPIIALSAAAMQEDRDRAQQAGMDGHVAKPIDRHELYSALTKLTGATSSTRPARTTPSSSDADTVLDMGHLQENVGSKEAAHRLLQKFKTQLIEGEFAAIDEALMQNTKQAHELIHSLKGLSGNVGAHRLYKAALQIDTLYKEGKTPLKADRNRLLQQKYKLIEKLDKIDNTNSDKQANQTISRQESKALFEKIQNQLRENELIDQADLDALHVGIKDTLSKQEWQRFESLATDFEFEQALKIMRGWNI